MSLQVGDLLLDKYRIERLLGGGGFGSVFVATDITLGRQVAIKELRPELSANPDVLHRFMREARSIAQLNNPNIVTILAWEETDEHKYIILEFMDGGNLADLLTKRNKLSPTEAATIARAICNGLVAVHAKNIYHRDIKPANILLSADGQTIKITDFGIAHVPSPLSQMGDSTLGNSGLGTPWYMSPEQARGEPVDHRSDLYSLGVVLYEMVSGYAYLDFTSDLLRDVAKVKNTPPRQMPASVPANLRQVISKSLHKDPAKRYQSAEEMGDALARFANLNGGIVLTKANAGRVPSFHLDLRKSAVPFIAGIIGLAILMGALVVANSIVTPVPTPNRLAIATSTTMPSATQVPSPTQDIRTIIAQAAEATISFKSTLDVQINATLTALAPTRTPTGTPTAIPSATRTGTPTSTPSPTATRQILPIRLLAPTNNQLFNNEKYPPVLEWRATTNVLLDNEYYRIQVYRPGQLACNDYTRDTTYVLPPSDTSPCQPGLWRFNTGDYNWRVSLVRRVDTNPDHDQEIVNSEGWLFRWLK